MSRSASADEAAAAIAAIARFQSDTAPEQEDCEPRLSPWQRAALIEGVGAKAGIEDLEEGGANWLS